MSWMRWIALSQILAAGPVMGQGFSENEVGVAAMGGAGAYVARAEDSSAVFINPAALARLARREVVLSAVPELQRSSYSNIGQTTWDSESRQNFWPYLAANMSIGKVGVGIGYTRTQSYDLRWDPQVYPGRFVSSGSQFETQELVVAAGYQFAEHFSVGLGLRSQSVTYDWKRVGLDTFEDGGVIGLYEVEQQVKADDTGIAFSAGLHYYPSRRFSMGLAYFSGTELNAAGRNQFAISSGQDDVRVQSDFASSYSDSDVATKVWVPQRVVFGLSTRTTVRTRVEFDVEWEQWSDWTATVFTATDLAGDGAVIHSIPRDWNDSFTLRIGGDFQQKKALIWRAGLALNQSIVEQEQLEGSFADADQFTISGGVSYTWQALAFEFAYKYVQYRDRTVQNQELVYSPEEPDLLSSNGQEGVFETQRHRFILGMKWQF